MVERMLEEAVMTLVREALRRRGQSSVVLEMSDGMLRNVQLRQGWSADALLRAVTTLPQPAATSPPQFPER